MKEKEYLVVADNICKSFKLRDFKYDTLKERVVGFFSGKKNKARKIDVLNNISFKIKKGESLGIIGNNGAGKSTLLRIIAGIYPPDSGTLKTNGNVFLLNLGAGFDVDANAEENIYLSGAILGFTRKEIKEKFDSIVEFSELKDFMDMPLKNYSSGMISRLGFAIAINTKPDLLLIDEVLSVGDANFQKKCLEKIIELKNNGTSFIFVSHNLNQVKTFCENALWIEKSKVKAYGNSGEVCKQYLDYCNSSNK